MSFRVKPPSIREEGYWKVNEWRKVPIKETIKELQRSTLYSSILWKPNNQIPYLSVLDFWKSLFHKIDFWILSLNLIFELDFLSVSKLIFSGYTGSKNQVWYRQKIELKNQVKKSILRNRDFKKSSTDR